jgi:HEPN domain-containing protein
VRKAESDIEVAREIASGKRPHSDETCFHCQQATEKYLKALLQETGSPVPRTHDLAELLILVLPHDATLRPLSRGLLFLSQFAVDYRYPGKHARKRQAESALRWAERIRVKLRTRLGLKP